MAGRLPKERARRPRGTGSIRQRGDSYTTYWFTTDPATGERRQHSKGGFATKGDAQSHLVSVLEQVQAGVYQRSEKVTVRELFEHHWLPVKASEGKSPNTIAHYHHAAKWVTDRIGAVPLASLTERHVAQMVAQMEKDGLSPRSRQAAVGALKAATRWAARSTVRLAKRDPLAEYHRPGLKGGKRPGIQAWTVEQSRTFLRSVADDRFVAAWALLLNRGLRRGELAGLRWEHVDLENGRLAVREARVSVNGKVTVVPPKSGEGRTISLDVRLVELLRRLRETQQVESEIAADAYEDSGYLFADALGRPHRPDFISKRFDALVARAGLPRLTVHGLRHTAATLMVADGVPINVVSEMLGHASSVITTRFYSHVLPGMAEKAGAALSAKTLS